MLACCDAKKHIVMVNVEADALAGRCWRRAREAASYLLAYGDQPALVCEMGGLVPRCGFSGGCRQGGPST